MWLGVALVVAMVTASGDAAETSRSAFYGLWLLMVAAGLASAPLVGGRDGDTSQAAFWALVVANAFRVIVIGASIILALVIVILVQVGQYGGTISGVLIWTLISVAATIAAAAVGSSQLRQDAARGRNTALVCVAVMVLLRVIDLSVLGWNPLVSDGAPVSMMLLAGTFVVIVFGLTVPGPMRQAVTRSRAIAGTGITGPPAMRRHRHRRGCKTRRPQRRCSGQRRPSLSTRRPSQLIRRHLRHRWHRRTRWRLPRPIRQRRCRS